MRKPTHLLVDLDGTLLHGDTVTMRMDFLYRMLRRCRRHGSVWQTLKALRHMQEAAEKPSDTETNHVRITRAFGEAFQVDVISAEKFLNESVLEVFPKLKRHFFPVPGAAEFLHWAKQDYSLILATNPIWIPKPVQYRVEWAGLELEMFQSFTHAEKMHACKPTAEYYNEILEQESLAPEDCLLIGNEMKNDLPANQVGISVFIINTQDESKHPVAKPIQVKRGEAPAWTGNYDGLKALLSKKAGSKIVAE